jgi:hypothetical protein
MTPAMVVPKKYLRDDFSSAELEEVFPYTSRVFVRTLWETSDHLKVNAAMARITDIHRCCFWNGIECYRFTEQKHAADFTDFIRSNRLHRLQRDSREGAGQAEVALEWMRVCEERQAILAWGRAVRGRTMEVVQTYRFERREGTYSDTAHKVAAKTVAALDPAVADPLNYAGVLIEWAEREHREWFWRCCRRDQKL